MPSQAQRLNDATHLKQNSGTFQDDEVIVLAEDCHAGCSPSWDFFQLWPVWASERYVNKPSIPCFWNRRTTMPWRRCRNRSWTLVPGRWSRSAGHGEPVGFRMIDCPGDDMVTCVRVQCLFDVAESKKHPSWIMVPDFLPKPFLFFQSGGDVKKNTVGLHFSESQHLFQVRQCDFRGKWPQRQRARTKFRFCDYKLCGRKQRQVANVQACSMPWWKPHMFPFSFPRFDFLEHLQKPNEDRSHRGRLEADAFLFASFCIKPFEEVVQVLICNFTERGAKGAELQAPRTSFVWTFHQIGPTKHVQCGNVYIHVVDEELYIGQSI